MFGNIRHAPDYLHDETLSEGTKEYLKFLNAGGRPVESLPPEDARKVLEKVQAAVKVDMSGIEEEEYMTIKYGGFSVELVIVRPKGLKEKKPVFMFLHGGGWVLGDYQTHKRLVRDLVVESGYPCVFVEYTRSPEATFPKAIDEIFAAAKWVRAHGDEINVDGKNMAIVGNSVGGNMSIATCFKAKMERGPKFKCQILLWPYCDAGIDFASYVEYAKDRFLTTLLMEWMRDSYINVKVEYDNILVSPLRATKDELAGLPPALIEVAESDILRDGGEQLGRKLDAAGVETVTVRFNGVIHDFGLLNGYAKLPQTRMCIALTAAMLKKHLK